MTRPHFSFLSAALLPWLGLGALCLAPLSCGESSKQGEPILPIHDRLQPEGVLQGAVKERDLRPMVDGRELSALVAGNTEFALSLWKTLSKGNVEQNMAVSPYSISEAMAMLYAGARNHTAEEMRTALHIEVEPSRFHPTFNGLGLEILSRNGDIRLSIANQVWSQVGFQPAAEFLDTLSGQYGAPLALTDFAGDAEGSRARINGWVERMTEKKIPELFPGGSIDANTVLVLTNAVYLDAPFKYQFDKTLTRPAMFSVPGGPAMVDMMHFDDFLPSGSGEGWQAVELPYRGDEVSLVAVLPRDLGAFEAALSPALLNEILSSIHDGGIHLSFPRFTFSFHASLVDAFKELGAPSLFGGGDLSGIGEGLSVQSIEHEVYVQVDEEGTKAAAATGVAIGESHGPSLSFDRPFLFFIVDQPTHTVLFMGRVSDPRAMP